MNYSVSSASRHPPCNPPTCPLFPRGSQSVRASPSPPWLTHSTNLGLLVITYPIHTPFLLQGLTYGIRSGLRPFAYPSSPCKPFGLLLGAIKNPSCTQLPQGSCRHSLVSAANDECPKMRTKWAWGVAYIITSVPWTSCRVIVRINPNVTKQKPSLVPYIKNVGLCFVTLYNKISYPVQVGFWNVTALKLIFK